MANVVPHSGSLTSDLLLFEYLHHGSSTNSKLLDVLDEAVGDFLFKCPVLEWAELFPHAFVYSFEHRTEKFARMFDWPD